jgi:hypothetical protein
MTAESGGFLEAALRYARLGYSVFPCVAGTKEPITEHGFLDATSNAELIKGWWAQHPTANIGIATEGLLIIDIDGEGNSWLTSNPEYLELSPGPMAITPHGGRHVFFRQPINKAWRCTESRLAAHVDTRADGGYIVVPPSIVDGKRYQWAPDRELENPPEGLPEPPAWLAEELGRCAAGASLCTAVASNSAAANLIPMGHRNGTLARLAGAMRRVGMSALEIMAALQQVNHDRCNPPLAAREVERIAASIARYQPDEVSVALTEDHWSQMYEDKRAEELPENPDPGPIPDHLLCVPGFIDAVMTATLETAPYPDRTLAFAAALSLQAVLAGRKVRDVADNRTNLYVLGLANSGTGKDYPRKVNQRILVEAGLAGCLGDSFASGEGIEDRLALEPAALFQVDELDGLLLRVNQAKDARHEQIVNVLLQMYSSANSVYVMRAKAGMDRAVIDQPCLCLFGTAVPKHFYEAISLRMLTNGFLARMLVLESPKRGRGREATIRPLPASVVETARWWAQFQPGQRSGNLSLWHPEPRLVDQTSEAAEVLALYRGAADDEYARAEERGDPAAMAIWARAYEKARRLALNYACSHDHVSPLIRQEAATWACSFAAHQTRRMLFMTGCHASESDFDAKRKRLLEVLANWSAQHGDQWMPFWMINRKLPWTSREHQEVRDTLVSQRLIEARTLQTNGRPGFGYRLKPPYCATD